MHQEHDDNSSEPGSGDGQELTGVGLNSLWGVIHTICKELNMTWYEVMWKRSWINIEMQLKDQARMVKKSTVIPKLTGAQAAARKKAQQ